MRAARFAHRETGLDNLVMAGGVALKCVANGRLLREGPFSGLWIQPAAGDAGGPGLGLGRLAPPARQASSTASSGLPKGFPSRSRLRRRRHRTPPRFDRGLLPAHRRRGETPGDHRPPLSEEQKERMRDPDLRVRVAVPRSTIPAVTHVDYSARVQTVDEERHGRFYRLMRRFYELTGCPVVVNTSFNIRGEPIVWTPEDAFRCFMATEMDCLVLENHLLLKEEQPSDLLEDAEAYKKQYKLD